MANEREYQGVQIGGRVPQRYLGKRDLSGLQHYIDVRNQRWDEAIKQKSAIDVALGQLKLNSAEDQWKYEYGKKIQKRIDDAAQFGDYSTALDTAILEAGKAISSPEVTGRIRANENYEKAKQEVAVRQDINSITKERWLDQNKYHYQDTYDDDGNIVGGTDWQASWNPVRRVQMEKLITLAGQLTSVYKNSTANSTATSTSDSEGIRTKSGGLNVQTNSNSVLTQSSSSNQSSIRTEDLSKERIDSVFNNLFQLDPDNMNSLQQDYDDIEWKINKLKDELNSATNIVDRTRINNEINAYSSQIYNDNGDEISAKDYMLYKVGAITKEMAFHNRYKETGSSSSTGRDFTSSSKIAYNNGGTEVDLSPIPESTGSFHSAPSSFITRPSDKITGVYNIGKTMQDVGIMK